MSLYDAITTAINDHTFVLATIERGDNGNLVVTLEFTPDAEDDDPDASETVVETPEDDDEGGYVCEHCGKTLPTESGKRRHVSSVHGKP